MALGPTADDGRKMGMGLIFARICMVARFGFCAALVGAPSIQAGPDLWADNNANGYPVVRWTCPRTGTYALASYFVGADSRGNNNLVWIVIGGSPVFSGQIQAYLGAVGYTNTLNLQNGAYIDFVVAWNGDTPYAYNWTVVNATITSVSNVVIQTQPQSQTNVVGSSVQFQVLASGSPPLHYQWQLNGTNLTDDVRISGTLSTNLVISNAILSDTGNYRVIVTNNYGSITSSIAHLSVVRQTTNVARNSSGATAVANSEFSGNGYFPASNTIDGNFGNYWGAIQGVYPWVLTVTFADYYAIVRFNLVEDTWDPAFATSGVIEYNNAGVWMTITNFSKNSPGLDFTLPVPVTCQQVRFTGTAASAPAGWYNKVPCVVEFEAYAILSSGAPVITVQPQSQCVVQGNNVTFTVTATGNPPFSYQWMKDWQPIASATNATFHLTNAQLMDAGGYSVRVSNPYGYVLSQAALLMVDESFVAPSITLQPRGTNVAVGDRFSLSVTATGTAPLSYLWSKDGTILTNGLRIGGVTSPNLSVANATLTDSGLYSVLVSNRVGFMLSSNVSITVAHDSCLVLDENFEDGVLDPRMSIITVGSFNSGPGIIAIPNFGSTNAFGFGRSTCSASCFDNYVDAAPIRLARQPLFHRIYFKEMELYGNWGTGASYG